MQASLTALQRGWQTLSTSIVKSAAVIGKALTGSIMFMAMRTILDYFSNKSAQAKRVKEIVEEQEKENAVVNELARSYEKLNTVTEKDNTKDNDNFTDKKKKLEELYHIYDKRGIEIPVELSKVTEKNINDVFNDAKNKLKSINDIMSDALRFVELDNDNFEIFGFTPFSDSVIEKTKDLSDELLNIISYRKDIESAFDIATNNYDKLNESAKEYYEQAKSLSAKYAKGEITNIEYVTSSYEALSLMQSAQTGNKPMQEVWVMKVGGKLNDLTYEMNDYNQSVANANSGWKKVLDYLDDAYGIADMLSKKELSPKNFEVILDRIATKNEFTQGAIDAFKNFAIKWAEEMGVKGLSFNIDKEEIKKEMDDLDKIFKTWFSNTTFHLGLEYED